LTDGYRESTESWAGLRQAKGRGMRAPVLAMGDGALGFWAALRDVFPETREQRCWFHKSANVLAALPKSAHPAAITAMQQIYNAENGDLARSRRRRSPSTTAPSSPSRSPRSPTSWTCCWSSTSTRPSIGCTCGRRTRVDVCDRPAPHEGDEGPRISQGRPGDGVQADRGRRAAVAGERTAAGRPRPRRRHLPTRETRRTIRREHRGPGGRLNDLDPQILPISLPTMPCHRTAERSAAGGRLAAP